MSLYEATPAIAPRPNCPTILPPKNFAIFIIPFPTRDNIDENALTVAIGVVKKLSPNNAAAAAPINLAAPFSRSHQLLFSPNV